MMSYCYEELDENANNSFYKIVSDQIVSDSARFEKSSKFGGKFLVWQAMSQNKLQPHHH